MAGRRQRRSEHRALPPRSDQGAAARPRQAAIVSSPRIFQGLPVAPQQRGARGAGSAGSRGGGSAAAAARRRARARRRAADAGARQRTRQPDRRPVRISATTSPCIRRSVSPAARARASVCCSTSAIRSIRSASTRRPTRTCRSGTPRRSTTTAPSCSSATNGAAAASRGAARPTSGVGRRRALHHREQQAEVPLLLQAAGAADGARELRRAQRIADSDSRPRRHGAGVVSGRPVGVRLDRHRSSEGDRVLRSRSGGRRRAC